MAEQVDATERLDRHALVMTVWAPALVAAVTLIVRGFALDGGAWWIAAGFVAILAGFAGHVIVNAVLRTPFTPGETALGAFAYAAALAALVLFALTGPDGTVARLLLPAGLGLAALLAAVLVYMVIAFGPRAAFSKFDVIRDNNLRPASRLPHRGGRR